MKKSTYIVLILILSPVVVSLYLKIFSTSAGTPLAPSVVGLESTAPTFQPNEPLESSNVFLPPQEAAPTVTVSLQDEGYQVEVIEEEAEPWEKNLEPKIVERLWESYGVNYEFPNYKPDSGEKIVDTIDLDEIAISSLRDGDQLILPGHMDLGYEIVLNEELTPGVRTILGYTETTKGEQLVKLVSEDGDTTGVITTDDGVFEVDISEGSGYLYHSSKDQYQGEEKVSSYEPIWGKPASVITEEVDEEDVQQSLQELSDFTSSANEFSWGSVEETVQ